MLNSHDDLCMALLARMDANPHELISQEAKDWYKADAETQNLKKMMKLYHAAKV